MYLTDITLLLNLSKGPTPKEQSYFYFSMFTVHENVDCYECFLGVVEKSEGVQNNSKTQYTVIQTLFGICY